jgi:hypothetical protein
MNVTDKAIAGWFHSDGNPVVADLLGRPDNAPQIPDGWVWWRDPQARRRLLGEYNSSGAPMATVVAYAYDPTDAVLQDGGNFRDAVERGAAKAFRFYPVRAMASTFALTLDSFEAMLPPDRAVKA